MTSSKTPQDVLDAIEKLDASDQVTIKTYIAKLKATIDEKDSEILTLKDGDSHAHYHGGERCTADHDHGGDSHAHYHGGERCTADHDHGHEHHAAEESHSHDHSHDDNIPEWKKKAMDSDPSAAPFGGSWNAETEVNASEEADFPPLYESGEDFDKATEHKMKASDLKMEGKLEEALEEYTLAVQAAPPSALLYANRATVLLELQKYKAAERDCNEALKENPDSAKALRVRGLARKEMGLYEEARHDLSESQTIDFDEGTVEALKEVTQKVLEIEKEKVHEKLEKEAKLRKRAEEIKKAQEEAKRESAHSSSRGTGSMPGGMGGNMPGMGGAGGMGGLMESLLSDPELAAAMQNPKVTAAFTEMMQNPTPAKMQELMSDPEVGPVLQKLIAKVGPGMGGMPGGGMGGMGGTPGGHDDDIPDIGDVDDNFDDLPDLE